MTNRRLPPPRRPVVVNASEIEALGRAWRHFLNTDMQIDPLATAIQRLFRRMREAEEDS